MNGAEIKKRRNRENMCEHTSYLSELREPVWNTLVFLLRLATGAAAGIGVDLALLDCHACWKSRSQQPEKAVWQGVTGRQGGLAYIKMVRETYLGGMGGTLEPPVLVPSTDSSRRWLLTLTIKKISVLLEP